MRLINADFLKVNEAHYDEEGVRIFYENEIDNAPTIEVPENAVNCVLTMFGKCSYNKTGCSDCEIKDKIRKALNERPHGKWIKQEGGYVCSVCGESNDYAYDNNINKFTDIFCPKCSAKMDGQEADNENN